MTDLGAGTGGRTTRARTTTASRRTAATASPEKQLSLRLVREADSWADEAPAEARFDLDDFQATEEEPELPGLDNDDPTTEDEDDGDFATRRLQARPADIELGMDSQGIVHWSVRPPDPGRLLDPRISADESARTARLSAYANSIANLRDGERGGSVVSARSLAEVYELLPHLTNTAFGVRNSELTRDKGVLVALPAGTVHLGFFTWKHSNDAGVQALASYSRLWEDDTATILASLRGAGATSDLSKILNWVRAVLYYKPVVGAFQAQYRNYPSQGERVLKNFAAALLDASRRSPPTTPARWSVGDVARSAPALKRALTGGIR